ncbi:hypothetical protein QBC46DRAFT_382942 [Diplogelasinospora grovesii]|uniref:Glycerate dehydrogenase n=1 Tax=Diplogelasinospora grovesii TaxID=303347 RepID=A0AAN6N8X7_9PEZI|nr:hypothetical protein QBC46DRAFT_382942 [Diplogelasinospora grovesii]
MEEIRQPAKLPDGNNHEVIVSLESSYYVLPTLDISPKTYEAIEYKHITAKDDVAERIKNASVVVIIICPINAQTLGEAKYLKAVITRTTGTDHIDLDECKRRGITVINAPGAAVEAVSEHAISLYFSARRKLSIFRDALHDFDSSRVNEWKSKGSVAHLLHTPEGKPPPTCSQEVVGMIGYGLIGKHIAALCRALGMKVLISARKPTTTTSDAPNPSASTTPVPDMDMGGVERVPFDTVLRSATVLMLALPLTPSSQHLLSTAELGLMRPDCVVVNISRGGIVDESAAVDALRQGKIYGYATDVFEHEPAGSDKDSVLLAEENRRGLNIEVTPHVAWASATTAENIQALTKSNIEAFIKGVPRNVLV